MPGLQQEWGYDYPDAYGADVGYGGLDPVAVDAWGPYAMDPALGDPFIADRLAGDRAYEYGLGAIGGLGDLGAFGAERMIDEERADVALRDRELGWDAGYGGDWGYDGNPYDDAREAEARLLEDRIALDRI